ncbi:MAG: hypothetical protein ACYTDU_15460 [Planctomycetota bacterium]|jgi:hypothetical protein
MVAWKWFALPLIFLLASFARAEDGKAGAPTREEFDKLVDGFDEFKRKYSDLEEENRTLRARLEGDPEGAARALETDTEAVLADLDPDPGRRNIVLLTGFAAATFQNVQGVDSTFSAVVVPIILVRPNDWILFETEIEFELEDDETHVAVGYAQLSFILNDYVTLGVGKFLLPFGTFWERWHPPWINKLPTAPLINAHHGGLIGESGLGIQLRGGAKLGRSVRFNYAVYLINGPGFHSDGAEHDAGSLDWGLNLDNNNNKTFGGRVGILPIPVLEIGASFLSGRADDSGSTFGPVDTLMLGIDLWFGQQISVLRGRLEIRAEIVWVDTDDVTFTDGAGTLFTFENRRDGWFVQVAYRPTMLPEPWRDFEIIVRFDQVQNPGPDEIGNDSNRITVGVDYWILPNVVAKVAWFSHNNSVEPNTDGVVVQAAIGF